MGTPKTLQEAITNGLEAWAGAADLAIKMEPILAKHIMDYLSQRFGAALLEEPDKAAMDALQKLWATLEKESKK